VIINQDGEKMFVCIGDEETYRPERTSDGRTDKQQPTLQRVSGNHFFPSPRQKLASEAYVNGMHHSFRRSMQDEAAIMRDKIRSTACNFSEAGI
jgi:hypothetical protein